VSAPRRIVAAVDGHRHATRKGAALAYMAGCECERCQRRDLMEAIYQTTQDDADRRVASQGRARA
jgi:hypothetical protein